MVASRYAGRSKGAQRSYERRFFGTLEWMGLSLGLRQMARGCRYSSDIVTTNIDDTLLSTRSAAYSFS